MLKSTLIAALLATSPAMAAGRWLSDATACGLSGPELEESDAVFLDRDGIGNHYFDCRFNKPLPLEGKTDWSRERSARCDNGAGQWDADFEIVQNAPDRVALFQRTGAPAPLIFHYCNR